MTFGVFIANNATNCAKTYAFRDEEYEHSEWFLDADHVGYVKKMLEDRVHGYS